MINFVEVNCFYCMNMISIHVEENSLTRNNKDRRRPIRGAGEKHRKQRCRKRKISKEKNVEQQNVKCTVDGTSRKICFVGHSFDQYL